MLAAVRATARRLASAGAHVRPARHVLALLLGIGLVAAGCTEPATAPAIPATGPQRLLVSAPGAYAFTHIDAGLMHSCAVEGSSTVLCWGSDASGQSTVPEAARSGVTQVTTGHEHSCALAAGAVTCWGSNAYGQSAVPAAAQTGVTQVSAGPTDTCAIGTGGAVTCWGRPEFDLPVPGLRKVPAVAQSGIAQISAGGYRICAVSIAGKVLCWGHYSLVSETDPFVPSAVSSGARQVSVGNLHACAVGAGGAVTCWGGNWVQPMFLVQVPEIARSGVTQVAAGGEFTCVLRDGAVFCWTGDVVQGTMAVPVAAQSGVTRISASYTRVCAIGAGGAATCWGPNGLAQPDVPAPPPTTTRVLPVATFTAPASVTAGAPIALALTGAQVPGHPQATVFTYAFACGTGAFGDPSPVATATCTTDAAGPLTVRGRVLDQDGDAASYEATVTVEAAPLPPPPTPQTLTFSSTPPSPAHVGATYAPVAASSAGLPVVLTLSAGSAGVCTIADGTVTFTGAGTCTVTADQAGNATHAPAPQVTQAITVTRRPQALGFTSTPASPAYVGTTYVPAAVSDAGLPVALSLDAGSAGVCTLVDGTVYFTAAGACTVAAEQGGNTTFAPAPRITQRVTVVRQPQAITITSPLPASAVVSSVFTLSATGGASGNPVVFVSQTPGVCTTSGLNGTTLTLGAAGPCAVWATQAGSAAYDVAPAAALAVTALSASQATAALRAAVAATTTLAPDLRRALTAKLDAALAELAGGPPSGACDALADFQRLVRAQRGRAIPAATADAWLTEATRLRRAVGC